MLQTTLGVAVLLVGLAGIVFSERVAQSQIRFNRWALGLEPLISEELTRGSVIVAGIFFMIFGLGIALHVIPAD